ncbi:MAG: threonine--tRNA ligase, partial [Betaproteobacteria bacterium]|nr:threonine--tRNA ligase [Betaproteobacteria bacterium]
CEADLRNDKISFKIRELSLQKIPFICVVGDKEKGSDQVAVRARGGNDLGSMSLDAFVALLRSDVEQRR